MYHVHHLVSFMVPGESAFWSLFCCSHHCANFAYQNLLASWVIFYFCRVEQNISTFCRAVYALQLAT